jgi:hypothetical protein
VRELWYSFNHCREYGVIPPAKVCSFSSVGANFALKINLLLVVKVVMLFNSVSYKFGTPHAL